MEEEKRPTTGQARRPDNGRANILTNSKKIVTENHDEPSEFPEQQQQDSGARPSSRGVSALTPPEASASKVYPFSSLVFYYL